MTLTLMPLSSDSFSAEAIAAASCSGLASTRSWTFRGVVSAVAPQKRAIMRDRELLPADRFCAKVRCSDLQPDSPDTPVVHLRYSGFHCSREAFVSLYGLFGGSNLPCACQLEFVGEQHTPVLPSLRDHRTARIQQNASACSKTRRNERAVKWWGCALLTTISPSRRPMTSSDSVERACVAQTPNTSACMRISAHNSLTYSSSLPHLSLKLA